MIDKLFEVIYGSEIHTQNMPNAPPDLSVTRRFDIKRQRNCHNGSMSETLLGKVIRDKVSGIEVRGGIIWAALSILQRLL